MTRWSELYPGDPGLFSRKWFKDPGGFTYTVPTPDGWDSVSPIYLRALARGCGGQGDRWGGGASFARSKFTATPGDTLLIQVGNTATANIPGDSFVKRSTGKPLCYADRGRGNGTGGAVANCIGDAIGPGNPGGGTVMKGGDAGSDAAYFAALDAGFAGYDNTGSTHLQAADFGGGGHGFSDFNQANVWTLFYAFAAGSGVVVIEAFLRDPLY